MHGRHGGNRQVLRQTLPRLQEIRDRIIANAQIGEGDVVLDVGTGDGLIGFGALTHVGRTGRVVFSDISRELLATCRAATAKNGTAANCDFVEAPADDLGMVGDSAVDVVTARAVLMYVRRKDRAFREFHRVLRPGGRLSIHEPINGFASRDPSSRLLGIDVAPVSALAAKVKDVLTPLSDSDYYPMLDFDERDLMNIAERVGFTEINLEYRAAVNTLSPFPSREWEVLREISPNPLAPSLRDAIDAALTSLERDEFVDHLRCAIASQQHLVTSQAAAYLWAVRP
jgi:SAM-dependent methyltransferase